MILPDSLNKTLYYYYLGQLSSSEPMLLIGDGFTIELNTKKMCLHIESEDATVRFTIFVTMDNPRMITYTIDTLMAAIIDRFGYMSDVAEHLDKVLRRLKLIPTQEHY